MNTKMSRRQRDIKSKLMAAIAMLLVSSIMMVSTTYAWFTLSTAPEVTGISTSVGANGNLEMALLPEDALTAGKTDYGITSGVGDSTSAVNLRNVTWGNLVDLGSDPLAKEIYGLDKISLYPSALNVATWDDDTAKLNPTEIAGTMLQTPAYGADGRVSELKADTTTSLHDIGKANFPQKAGTGVRAVGTAAGMTDRQLAYRNARSAASTAMAQAKNSATQSLNTNGSSLGNIAVGKAMGTTTYKQTDIAPLKAIVNDLLGSEGKTGTLQYIENAYKQYIIAYAASAACQPVYQGEGETATKVSGLTDTEFEAFASVINGCADLTAVKNELGSITVPYVSDYMNALIATKNKVLEAQTKLNALTGDNISWEQLSGALNLLADMNTMTVNNRTVDELAAKDAEGNRPGLNDLISDVTSGKGITVTMSSGGGVYADIADHCGNYFAAVTMDDVTYNGLTVDIKATMETNCNGNYLANVGNAVTGAGAPAGGSGQIMPITDFYGYIIDLAFRTNAAESNLLLQTAPADRIYTDNKDATADTMGGGSTMTFTSQNASFSQDQVIALMDAIRIVFMEPASNKVLATAKLDTAAAVKDADGKTVTANIYLYQNKDSVTTYEEVPAGTDGTRPGATHIKVTNWAEATDGNPATHYKTADSTEYVEITTENPKPADATGYYISGYTYQAATENATHKANVSEKGPQMITDRSKAVIAPLTQNVAKAVSALVYLDGEKITNADVAANGSSSMTGTMNLQFASSANLVPMNYTPLMNQGGTTTETTEATEAPTT